MRWFVAQYWTIGVDSLSCVCSHQLNLVKTESLKVKDYNSSGQSQVLAFGSELGNETMGTFVNQGQCQLSLSLNYLSIVACFSDLLNFIKGSLGQIKIPICRESTIRVCFLSIYIPLVPRTASNFYSGKFLAHSQFTWFRWLSTHCSRSVAHDICGR